MEMSLNYESDDNIDIHHGHPGDVKPYDEMMTDGSGSFNGNDLDEYQHGPASVNTDRSEDMDSSIGMRRRMTRFSQDETRYQRMGTRVGNSSGGFNNSMNNRPKRVLQHWARIKTYPNAAVAEEALRSYMGCRWMRGNKSNTKEGRKEYYSCREGTSCPAMIHLLYDANSSQVFLFQNDSAHLHIGERKRGLPAQVEQIIRKLFATGTRKPSQIQHYLLKEGIREIQKSQLANFLQKIKREMGETAEIDNNGLENSFYSGENNMSGSFHASWLEPGAEMEMRSIHQQGDSLSDPSCGGIAPLAFAAAEYNSPVENSGSVPSPAGGINGSNVLLNFSGLTPAHTLQPGSQANGIPPAAGTGSTAGNQSEIVSSSCGKKFYCRDESTEDGEHCLPNEENIKESILQHLMSNYSNRDMLHIREELRTLKKEKKYPVLNRLASFTAGFLQDTFMDDHTMN